MRTTSSGHYSQIAGHTRLHATAARYTSSTETYIHGNDYETTTKPTAKPTTKPTTKQIGSCCGRGPRTCDNVEPSSSVGAGRVSKFRRRLPSDPYWILTGSQARRRLYSVFGCVFGVYLLQAVYSVYCGVSGTVTKCISHLASRVMTTET